MLERDDGFKNDAVGNKRQERERADESSERNLKVFSLVYLNESRKVERGREREGKEY